MVRLTTALRRIDDAKSRDGGGAWRVCEATGARVRAPRAKTPWGCVHFVGGAVLGSFPDVAYDAWLSACADDVGLVVVATPYELDLDHEKCAMAVKKTYDEARRLACAKEGMDASRAPTFRVGHSLGCKLLCLVASAEDANEREGNGEAGGGTIDMDVDATSGTAVAVSGTTRGGVGNVAGHFLVAFNNADATDSVKLVEKFARELLKKRAGAASGASEEFFKTLPNLAAFAERAAKAAGLEFKPTPAQTLERCRTRFASKRVRLIKFKDDDLDQNDELLEVLRERMKVYPGRVDARELDFGNHLTPVYFSTDGLKLTPALEKLVGQFALGDAEGVRKLSAEFAAFIRDASS